MSSQQGKGGGGGDWILNVQSTRQGVCVGGGGLDTQCPVNKAKWGGVTGDLISSQ